MAGFAISLNYGAGDEALLCSGSKYMRSSQSEMAGNCKVFLRNDFFGNRFAVEHLHLPRSRPRSPWLIYHPHLVGVEVHPEYETNARYGKDSHGFLDCKCSANVY